LNNNYLRYFSPNEEQLFICGRDTSNSETVIACIETESGSSFFKFTLPYLLPFDAFIPNNGGRYILFVTINAKKSSSRSVYQLFDTRNKRMVCSCESGLNRKSPSPSILIPTLSAPFRYCISPIISGLYFFVSESSSSSSLENISAVLLHCDEASEFYNLKFSNNPSIFGDLTERKEKHPSIAKITTLHCHPDKPLLFVVPSLGPVLVRNSYLSQ